MYMNQNAICAIVNTKINITRIRLNVILLSLLFGGGGEAITGDGGGEAITGDGGVIGDGGVSEGDGGGEAITGDGDKTGIVIVEILPVADDGHEPHVMLELSKSRHTILLPGHDPAKSSRIVGGGVLKTYPHAGELALHVVQLVPHVL